jgi:hypothetical protein
MSSSTAPPSGALKGQLHADTRVLIRAGGTATAMACQCKICSATGRPGMTSVQDNAAGQQNSSSTLPAASRSCHSTFMASEVIITGGRTCSLTASSTVAGTAAGTTPQLKGWACSYRAVIAVAVLMQTVDGPIRMALQHHAPKCWVALQEPVLHKHLRTPVFFSQ